MKPLELIDDYLNDPASIDDWVEEFERDYGDRGFTATGLRAQIRSKLSTIAAVESYLLANLPEDASSDSQMMADYVDEQVRETLAFSIATEEQKEILKKAFQMLAEHVVTAAPDPVTRTVFSKTLFGVTECVEIEKWLTDNIDRLSQAKEDTLLDVLWQLLRSHIRNSSFGGCSSTEALKAVASGWITGMSYHQMLKLLDGSRIGRGTRPRIPKIQHAVDICENALGFEGTLIVGAIAQLLEHMNRDDYAIAITRLNTLQKRLRYGLATSLEVVIFELGFADRPLALELEALLGNAKPARSSLLQSIRQNEAQVRTLLDKYPSYFTVQLDALLQV